MKLLSIALTYILLFAQVVSAAPLLPTQQKVVYRGTLTGLTISAVDGAAFIDNATISALGGSVTRANMKLSAVDGTAFVDFSTANILTDYVSDRAKLTVFDSTGKKLVGYIKAAGTGETYNQIYSSTAWTGASGSTPPTGWNVSTAGVFSIVDEGGDYTTALKIEHNGTNNGPAINNSNMSTVIGKRYVFSFAVKKGTSAAMTVFLGLAPAGNEFGGNNYTNADWSVYSYAFVATTTVPRPWIRAQSSSAGLHGFLDSVTLNEVLTPLHHRRYHHLHGRRDNV